ncbi:HPr family phosphocarrier protein [Anaerostipes hadrus]|uniref:Phosphotransferase system HPr (HPr) family protein n=2 Tax=Anaerostipes hadrus TaxID=649756 RepID=A0A1Q2C5A0_ANAHA|nr:phosphotransferase system HPr (HPr) family protein [Anaerostipes hadrus]EKY21387.1 phosphocarrier, HPr family [Anaerostipes hadrus ATCC 29173 = JCM 17467]MBS5120625.1 HPr family phosphocarrier protein [Lachnospiraceae bacterium]RHU14597.1 HPr family phosphocarrier protein [Lachnospiraceae bacterium AM25-27]NSH15451.1 HPr family phosphocarrier protein [Anaerostipes hadrus]
MKGLLYFMKRYDFTITSDRGLHAQPVAALASIACKSASCVTLEYDGGEIDVSNAIHLMSACISYNDKVNLIVSGSDEDETMEKLKEIVTSQLL